MVYQIELLSPAYAALNIMNSKWSYVIETVTDVSDERELFDRNGQPSL